MLAVVLPEVDSEHHVSDLYPVHRYWFEEQACEGQDVLSPVFMHPVQSLIISFLPHQKCITGVP
jgi:hypothetical protein